MSKVGTNEYIPTDPDQKEGEKSVKSKNYIDLPKGVTDRLALTKFEQIHHR